MLASISRGSSKLNRIYICPSCLSGLTGGTAAVLPTRVARCYTSASPNGPTIAPENEAQAGVIRSVAEAKLPVGGTRRLKSRRTRSRPRNAASRISNSKETISALKASLLAEDVESNKKEQSKVDSSRASKKIATSFINGEQPNIKPEAPQVRKTSEDATKRPSAKKKQAKKSLKLDAAETKATPLAAGGSADKGKQATRTTESKVTGPTVRLIRASEKSIQRPSKQVDSCIEKIEYPAARSRLLRVAQAGMLSEQEASRVIKLLGESIVRGVFSPTSQANIKDAMLGNKPTLKPLSGKNVATKVPPEATRPPRVTKGRTSGGDTMKTGPMKEKPGMAAYEIKTIEAEALQLIPVEKEQPPVPSLSYGLERVLFNPGVYQLQDPRSRVFNFDPYLQKIMPVNEFDFNALKEYITSSRDDSLLATAIAEKKKYTGSTSSTTSALAHFHFLLSQWRHINTGTLSRKFPVEFETFTALQRGPSAIFLRWRDGVYAIDADKEFDTANILSMLGKSMEKLLTLPTEDFEKYRKQNSDQIPEEARNEAESFHYTTIGDFLLRSQLDAHDSRLPGTGMFDLKTRAVVSIRMDTSEYEQGSGYEIRYRHGEWESYEREYYDMIRAAFLKYSLQVRMGRMDGIFVAFHNTERIFGFQYISLSEMDHALHGTENTILGDSEFKLSLELLNRVLDRATAKYPEKSLRIHFETRGGSSDTPFMYIFAEPMEESEIQAIQESNKEAIAEFEQRVLGMEKSPEEIIAEQKAAEEARLEAERKVEEEQKKAEWESLQARVQESMDNDEFGVDAAESVDKMKETSDSMSAEEAEQRLEEIFSATALDDGSQDDADDEDDNLEEGNGDDEDSNVESEEAGHEDGDEDQEEEEVEDEHEEEDEEEEMEEEAEEREEDDSKMQVENQEKHHDEDRERDRGGPTEIKALELHGNGKEPEGPELTSRAKLQEMAVDSENPFPLEERALAEGSASNSCPESAEMNTIPGAAHDEHLSHSPAASTQETPETTESRDVLAMTLTIRNKVNGRYLVRPNNLQSSDKWTVEYALAEVPSQPRAQSLYEAAKKRRKNALSFSKDEKKDAWNNQYIENLRKLSRRGREWRKGQNQIDASGPVKLLEIKDGLAMDKKDRDVWGTEEKSDE